MSQAILLHLQIHLFAVYSQALVSLFRLETTIILTLLKEGNTILLLPSLINTLYIVCLNNLKTVKICFRCSKFTYYESASTGVESRLNLQVSTMHS